ncbi:MAG: MerR family transcriptional regulator [Saprospiraceae bacterium]
MAVYTISDLEKLSGVKAHTIRVWEKRYGLIQPRRTPANVRYYEDEHLRKLLNVTLLKKQGLRISKIADLSEEDILCRVAAASDLSAPFASQPDALTLAMLDLDEFLFDRILRRNTEQHGFERTVIEVIYPFLDRLGLLWVTDGITTVHHRFVSRLIRRKLMAAIDGCPPPPRHRRDLRRFLLFLPPGEEQELLLLFIEFLLRNRSFATLNLGSDIDLIDLGDARRFYRPTHVLSLLSDTHADRPATDFVWELTNVFPEAQLLLSGYQVVSQGLTTTPRCRILTGLQDTIAYLDACGQEN